MDADRRAGLLRVLGLRATTARFRVPPAHRSACSSRAWPTSFAAGVVGLAGMVRSASPEWLPDRARDEGDPIDPRPADDAPEAPEREVGEPLEDEPLEDEPLEDEVVHPGAREL